MKTKNLILLLFALSLLFYSCKKEPHVKVKRKKIKAEVSVVKKLPVLQIREYPGRTKADKSIILASKTSGMVKKILVDEGYKVKSGQLLIKIDDTDIRAKISALDKGIKALSMKKKALLADFEYVKKNFHRYKALLKEEAVTQEEFDRIKSKFLAIKKEIESVEYEIKRLKNEKRAVSALLKYTRIKAPFSGTVSKKFVDEGTFITAGTPLMALNSKENFTFFVTSVDEELFDTVKKLKNIPVFIKALNRTYVGTTYSISSVDPQSSSFRLKLKLPQNLPSGLFGRAFIPTKTKYAIVIPQKAIVQRGNLKAVYTIDPENIVHFQVIRCGSVYEKTPIGLVPLPLYQSEAVEEKNLMVEVLAGLKEGERIVTSNIEDVREGDQLE